MTNQTTINVAKDYSLYPAGRFETDGPYSGAKFRNTILAPALKSNDEVIIIIDGVSGYGSSFLEEGFGGLVRELKFKKDELKRKLRIRYEDKAFKMYESMIWEYIEQAK